MSDRILNATEMGIPELLTEADDSFIKWRGTLPYHKLLEATPRPPIKEARLHRPRQRHILIAPSHHDSWRAFHEMARAAVRSLNEEHETTNPALFRMRYLHHPLLRLARLPASSSVPAEMRRLVWPSPQQIQQFYTRLWILPFLPILPTNATLLAARLDQEGKAYFQSGEYRDDFATKKAITVPTLHSPVKEDAWFEGLAVFNMLYRCALEDRPYPHAESASVLRQMGWLKKGSLHLTSSFRNMILFSMIEIPRRHALSPLDRKGAEYGIPSDWQCSAILMMPRRELLARSEALHRRHKSRRRKPGGPRVIYPSMYERSHS